MYNLTNKQTMDTAVQAHMQSNTQIDSQEDKYIDNW